MSSLVPDRNAVHSYGIVERAASDGDAARYAEQVRILGYAVVPGGFSAQEIGELGRRLDRVMETQAAEFGAERLAAIGETLTARCPLAYDEIFLKLAAHEGILSICRLLLGDYVILTQQNGVINPPGQGHTQLAYHRDLPYQHFVSSRPLAMSALFCLDPFVPETGATTVLPASHRVEAFPSEEVSARIDTSITADPGAFIIFDSMLFHRAGTNRSDRPRRGVNHVFSIPIIAQQISLPDALQGKYADDPALSRLLGYEVAPARSVRAWRERRLARKR